RHDHHLLGVRIELVESLGWPPGPHPERERPFGTPLGEDPLRFLHGRQRLGVAFPHAGEIPFVRRVALLGQHPQPGHDAYAPFAWSFLGTPRSVIVRVRASPLAY